MLRIDKAFEIDNPHEYPPAILDQLRELLIGGVSARPDPKRENFYDVEGADRIFFIHVSQANTVMLLAAWLKSSAESDFSLERRRLSAA